jgi:hypothetical protein
MAKLTGLYLLESNGGYYLRADWDNARHHSVVFESDDPYDVIRGLEEFVYWLRKDLNVGVI